MVQFNPKLIVIENDNAPMIIFKQLVAEKLFGIESLNGNSFSIHNANPYFDHEKLKFFTFTGMENNTYLFVS